MTAMDPTHDPDRRQEERLPRAAAQELEGRRGDRMRLVGADVDDVVVAQDPRIGRDVLFPDERD